MGRTTTTATEDARRPGRLTAALAVVSLLLAGLFLVSDRDHPAPPPPTVTIACSPTLAALCGDLVPALGSGSQSLLADEATMAARLERSGGAGAPADVWLATAPWPGLVEEARASSGASPVVPIVSLPVASSPLVAVGRPDLTAAVETACGGTMGWDCLADLVGRRWSQLGIHRPGRLRVAIADPDTSAVGVLTVARLVGSRTPAGFGFDAPALEAPAPQRTARRLTLGVVPVIGPSTVTSAGGQGDVLVLTTEADAALHAPRGHSRIVHLPALTSVQLVLAGADREQVLGVQRVIVGAEGRRVLRTHAWRGVGVGSPLPDAPAMPVIQEIPTAPGVDAVQRLWAALT